MKLTSTDAEELRYVRALVYGETGIGKTTSLRTLVPDRTSIALCERGALPLQEMSFPVFHLEDWEDVGQLYKMFTFPERIEDEKNKAIVAQTKVLVVDSLSEVGDLCWAQILHKDRPALLKERAKGKDAKSSPEGIYADNATMEDWGVYGHKMMRLISAYCHLPLHVIFTCGADTQKDKQSNDTNRLPALGGKTARKCLALFDLVLYMKTVLDSDGKGSRVWQTYNDGFVLAKDASGKLSPEEPPNWLKLFQKLLPKKTGNGSAKK